MSLFDVKIEKKSQKSGPFGWCERIEYKKRRRQSNASMVLISEQSEFA